jgi:YidC/Oxa1 family membrane protein insertase
MGISMFIQQKITPTTTTDPMQQKVMLWMPVIFSSMMLTLPSGLTLYILISTVFGISQQYIFMKDKSPAAVPAKA